MRIQNNVTAMNTHRMYTINNDAVAASAKKLSSGYRINSAADDAAGLAISEKMRSQIRGLNMATKNSQDAISLVQTAEGALQETQNMLQRMNELAVQAATGTNETLDRNALAKEFEQLKKEINDIAEQTTFNNMKILDGSLSYTGYVRSSATAGVTQTTESTANAQDLTPVGKPALSEAIPGQVKVDKTAGSITVPGSSLLKDSTQASAAGQTVYEIDLGIEGVGKIKIDGNTLGGTASTDTAMNSDLGGRLATALNTLKTTDLSKAKADTADSATTVKNTTYSVGASKITFESIEAAKALQDQLKSGDYTVKFNGTNLTFEEKAETAAGKADGKEGQGTLSISDVKITKTDIKAVGGATGDGTIKGNGTTGDIDKTEFHFTTNESNKADLDTALTEDGKAYKFEISQTTGSGSTAVKTVLGTIEVTGEKGKSIGQLINEKYGEPNTIELKTSSTTSGNFNVAYNKATNSLSFTAMDASTKFGNTSAAISMSMSETAPAEENTALTKDGADGSQLGNDAAGASKTYDLKFPTGADGETGVLKNGQRLEIDGKTYTFTDKETLADGEFNSMDSLIAAINKNDGNVTASKVAAMDKEGNPVLDDNGDPTYVEGKLTLSQAVDGEKATQEQWEKGDFTQFKDANLEIKWTGPVGDGTKTTVEFDFAKMQVGDKVTINIGGTKGADGKVAGGDTVTVEKKEGQSRADFMAAVKEQIKGTGAIWENDNRVDVRGNAIIASGTSMNVEMELTENGLSAKNEKTNAVRIQVGALEDEQLAISIDSMNTAGLGLDGVSLMAGWDGAVDTDDQDAAGAAITATRNAINKISDQRATLGAMQNRLDHKIANLKISSENLTASESRIRDVDMAQEMTNFTKNNILSQAATAMLAQANSLPQNVLSLLG